MGTPLPRRLGPQGGGRACKTMERTLAGGGRGQGSVGSGERGHSQEAHLHPYIFVLCSSRSFSSPEENEKEDGPLRPPEVAGWVTARPLPSPAATTGSRVPLNCQFRLLSSARSRVQRLSALGPRSHTSPRPLPGEGPPASSPRPPLHAGTRAGDPRDIGASTLHPPGVASAAGQGGGICAPADLCTRGEAAPPTAPRWGARPAPRRRPTCLRRRHGSGVQPAARTRGSAPGAPRRASGGGGARGPRGRGSLALGASARSGRARCAQRGGREAGRGRREPGGLCSLRPPPGPAAALAPPRAPRRPPGSAPGLGGAACPPRSASGCPAAPALAGLRSPPPSAAARGGRSRSPASLLPTLSRAETAPLLCSSCSSDPPLRVLPPRALLTA